MDDVKPESEKQSRKRTIHWLLTFCGVAPDDKLNRESLIKYLSKFGNIQTLSPKNHRTIIKTYVDRIILYGQEKEFRAKRIRNPNHEELQKKISTALCEMLWILPTEKEGFEPSRRFPDLYP